MTTKSKGKIEIDFERLRKEVADGGRNLWLAGLGALAEVEEEGERLFNQLVERGKTFEEKRRKIAEERLKGATDRLEDFGGKIRHRVEGAVNDTIKLVGLPTRDDIEQLNSRLETLSAKLDSVAEARR